MTALQQIFNIIKELQRFEHKEMRTIWTFLCTNLLKLNSQSEHTCSLAHGDNANPQQVQLAKNLQMVDSD